MKHLLPTGRTVAIFAAMAIGCAAIASLSSAHDLAMAVFALPIFGFAAWMGMRSSGQWAGLSEPAIEAEEAEEEIAA